MGIFQTWSDNRLARKEAKYNYKTDKQDGKTDRTYLRTDSKTQRQMSAYENGIDPNGAMWGAIGQVGTSATQALGGGSMIGSFLGGSNNNSANGANNNMIMLAAAGAAAYFIFKK